VSLDTDASSSDAPNLFGSRRSRLFVGRRGLAASSVSTVLLVGAIVLILFVAPGGAVFRYYFFNFHDMRVAWDGHASQGISALDRSLFTNVWMFLVSEALVLIFGLTIAWVRISHTPVLFPVRMLVTVYTDVFRGVPLLIVVYLVGDGLPALRLGFISNQSPSIYGVVALTLTYSAYVSEVLRAGINSVPNGQLLAARSLGLSPTSTMRHVVLPQAVRTVIPPLLNDFVSLQKDTALVSVLGVIEIANAGQISASTLFNGSGLVAAALFFLALTIPMTRLTDHLIERDRARRLAGS
jgi:polar amino acid transport system permease protein